MFPTKLIAATVAGAAFGAGTLALGPALAADTSGGTTAAKTAHHARADRIGHLRGVIHAEWTTRNLVRHEAIRGVVKAVSGNSVTVRAIDGVTETYAVTSATKVRMVDSTGRHTEPISDVKVGDRALVVGKGDHQATVVVARAPKSTSGSSSTQG